MSDPAVLILSLTVLVLAILLGLIVNQWYKAIKEINRAIQEINRKENVIIREKGNRRDVGVQYFTEEVLKQNIFFDKHEVRYKVQLLVDNLPIGMPSEFRRDITKTIDKKQVNKILDEFAKPLLDASISVAVKHLS